MSNTTQKRTNANRTKYEGIITDFAGTMTQVNPPETLSGVVKNTITNFGKATLADLRMVVADIRDFQKGGNISAPVEAALKKPTKKVAKKTAETPDKKTPVKNPGKVKTVPGTTEKGADDLPLPIIFPETIESEDYGTLVRQDGKFTTWDEVKKALDDEKQIFFACFWTKRQLTKFNYAKAKNVKVPKDGFPDDLDLCLGVLPCQTMNRVYAMSVYTEAMTFFDESSLDYIIDNDPRNPDGESFKIRMNHGMEYEIYLLEDED